MQSISLKTLSDLQLGEVLTRVLPPVISVLLVFLIADKMASLTWQVLPLKKSAPVPVSSVSTASSVKNTQFIQKNEGAQIADWHLFGVVPKTPPKPVVVQPVAPQEAPDTTLNLSLKGVVASRDMLSAWAIIADRSGNEDTYGINANLPGGAILKEIYADRIILLHNGQLETLRLPQDNVPGNQNGGRYDAQNRNVRSGYNNQLSRYNPAIRRSGTVHQLSYQATQIVKSYKQKLLTDPQSVMNTLRAQPYRSGGRLAGYRIFPGNDKTLFGKLGLQPGDVVTAVNGIALDSPLKGLEVMKNLSDASEVSVDVLRNGVSQTYMVPLN